LRAITRCQDDGAAQDACRALRKNSDARTIDLTTGMMFLSAIGAAAAGLFHHANVKSASPAQVRAQNATA
jgi:hypothetical protein